MDTIERIAEGLDWEKEMGYVRAVKIGDRLEISGTAAVLEGEVIAPGDTLKQSEFILAKLGKILRENGFEWKHVVRNRIYMTNIDRWTDVADAHSAIFEDHPPACTLLGVSQLIHPDLVVEMEISAERPSNGEIENLIEFL